MAAQCRSTGSELDRGVEAAAAAIRGRFAQKPLAAVVLGSGLGGLADELDDAVAVPFDEIPGCAPSTSIGHAGRLVCGQMAGVTIVAQQGRLHLYEGYAPVQAAFPVRVASALGASTLIVTNAAGGLNPQYAVGDLMLIDDHVNLMFNHPLEGADGDRPVRRYPDKQAIYDRRLQRWALQIARREGVLLHRGAYVAVLGPNYETRAEYGMCRTIGGDAVGMSTIPEVSAARRAGMRVLGISTITNVSRHAHSSCTTTGHDVIANAAAAAGKVAAIIQGVLQRLDGRRGDDQALC